MGRIVKGIFGGSSDAENILKRFKPVGFQSAGATGSYNPATNTYSISQTPARQAAVQSAVSGFNAQSSALAGLRDQVAPGFGNLSTSLQQSMQQRVNAIRDAGRSAVGNIREGLARRRLAGSSFQQSEVASAQAEFAKQEDQARADAAVAQAQGFVQEIAMSQGLIKDQFASSLAATQTILGDLNFDQSTVASLASMSSQLINANLGAQAEFRDAQQAAGEDFLGTIIGMFAPKIPGVGK